MGADISCLCCLAVGASVGGSRPQIEANRSFAKRIQIYAGIALVGLVCFIVLIRRCASKYCDPENGDTGIDVDAWGAGFFIGMGCVGMLANYSRVGTASDPDRNYFTGEGEATEGIAMSASYEPVTIEESDVV